MAKVVKTRRLYGIKVRKVKQTGKHGIEHKTVLITRYAYSQTTLIQA